MEQQLAAVQNTVQQLAQTVATLQTNIQQHLENGTQQGAAAATDPGADQQAASNQDGVVIETSKDAKILKQLTQSRTFTKIGYQKTDTFVKFADEIKDWFRIAGVSVDEVEQVLTNDRYKLSTALDAQLQIIISNQADELVRKQLQEAVPRNTRASGLGDLRNLYKAFGLNKISQLVRLVATASEILNSRGAKPFRSQFERLNCTVHRAIELTRKEDPEFLEKGIIASLAASYPQIAQSLNVQLSLADKQKPSALLESLSQAATGAAKRKRHQDEKDERPIKEHKRKDIEFYCSHCGKPNHTSKECYNKEKPAIRLSFKLHALRKANSDGKLTADSVRKVLGISHTPLALFSMVNQGEPHTEPEAKEEEDGEVESKPAPALLDYINADL